jgi:hypothetical protein
MILDELKEKLVITNTSQDANLGSIISRGKARLNGLAGVTLDFDSDGLPHDLLLEYCRYDYNNALEYFEENFSKEILRLQLESAVKDYVENQS